MRHFLTIYLILAFGFAPAASAADYLPGPFPAEIISVYDGDTIKVRADIWLDQSITVSVRVNGVDTPEMKGKCEFERTQAEAAKQFVSHALENKTITIRNIQYDKYAGRVVADIYFDQEKNLKDLLITNGLAKPYDGGHKEPWCVA